jgi:N-acetylglucosamine kinase-like BadF-type ATPase
MQYLLGFDCGATKIECSLADLSGKIIFNTKRITAANLLINGIDSVSNDINSIVIEIFNSGKFDKSNSEFQVMVIGAAGAGRTEHAEELKTAVADQFKINNIVCKKLIVVSDALIALEASFPGKAGCILIAGTGSIIYGKDENGKIFRAGGFGRLIGDEGSGYSIGRKALNRAARDFDAGEENSSAVKLVTEKYSIKSIDDLLTKVHKDNFDIASVAKHVIMLAEQKVQFAVNILDEESDELILLIKTLMNKIKVEKLEISFNGSLIDQKNFYSNMLREKIQRHVKTVTVIDKEINPVEGAIYLAKGLVDV